MTKQVIATRRLSSEAAELMRAGIDRQFESATKSFGTSQLAQIWLAGMDMPDSTQSKPTKPYSQVALVFTCVNKLISSIAGLPLVLSTIDEKIIESGPVYDVLFNNPLMSFQKFVTDTIGHYALSRDVFWVFTDMQGRQPKEIAVVSGTQMHPITHNRTAGGVLLGWEFRGIGGQRTKFTLDEVYQWKNFNPYDKFHGLGPASAAELNINYSYAADLYNANALANGAEPGIILTTQGGLDPDQVELLRNRFDARHRGAAKAKRTAVLTGGMDAKTIAMKMTDMQVAKISEMSDKKLCSTFGVPPGVAGLITEAQYSHGPAMQDFIFNTVIPLAKLFAGELTYGIISKFYSSKSRSLAVEPKDSRSYQGRRLSLRKKASFSDAIHKAVTAKSKLFAWFDYDQHPVVQEVNRDIAAKVLDYTKAGVPLNDIIKTHNLPYEETEAGKYWWIGMGQVPATYALEAGLEGLTGPPYTEDSEEASYEDNKDTGGATKEQKQKAKANEQARLRLWQNWVISWAGIEKEYKEAMRKFFIRQERILIGKLKKALTESKAAKADAEQVIARVVFDLKTEDGKIRVINQIFFEKAGELGARQSLSEILGISGEELDQAVEQAKRMPLVRAALTRQAHKITGVNRFTQKLVANQLNQGIEAGEDLNQLTRRIKTTLGLNRNRALRIARTQTAGAVSTGRHAGMKEAGVERKAWITAGDENVRDSHRTAGETYTDGIPLDQPFQVGGDFLMYPGDPAGSAANIIFCRCVSIAKKAAGKDFGLAYYANLKFYSYNDMQNLSAQAEPKNEVKENGT